MRYHKVLFCIPPFTTNPDSSFTAVKPRTPFTGVGYLSTFLKSKGIKNDVIDMTLGYKSKDLLKRIKIQKPDLIGFFVMTSRHDITYELVNLIKEKFDVDVVLGGPHISTLRKQVLRACKADFGIKLEGELTLLDLIKGKKLEKIKGLIYRKNDKVIENPDREFIKNLDKIPFPTYEKFELGRYADNAIPIISSRGCPYSCIYCPVQVAIGKKFRMRSAESVLGEMEYWYQNGYRKFDFLDDNFTLVPERVRKICGFIKGKGWDDLILNCPNGVRADRIDFDLLKLMKSVGFKSLAFGVEGGNNRILKNIKKGEKIEDIERGIKNACELGFDVTLFFLVGSPGETVEDVKDSIRLALKYPVVDALFYSEVPYPGTELHQWVTKNGYFVVDPDNYLANASGYVSKPFFATPEFTVKERVKMLKLTRKLTRKIRKRSIARRYGLLGKIFSGFLTTDFATRYIINNNLFLRTYNWYLLRRKKKIQS